SLEARPKLGRSGRCGLLAPKAAYGGSGSPRETAANDPRAGWDHAADDDTDRPGSAATQPGTRTPSAVTGRLAHDWDASAGAGDDLPWPYVVHMARGRRLRIDAL